MVTSAEAAAIRASFRQEVAVWQKLDHPNVTKVIVNFLFTHNNMDDLVLFMRSIIFDYNGASQLSLALYE